MSFTFFNSAARRGMRMGQRFFSAPAAPLNQSLNSLPDSMAPRAAQQPSCIVEMQCSLTGSTYKVNLAHPPLFFPLKENNDSAEGLFANQSSTNSR